MTVEEWDAYQNNEEDANESRYRSDNLAITGVKVVFSNDSWPTLLASPVEGNDL